MRYVLASGSPRRKELLQKVIPEYEVIPAQGEENSDCIEPDKLVEELSFQKASEIFHKIFTNDTDRLVVIGADTVVSYNRRVLGKPKDRQDAVDMIKNLSGDTHAVYTGVTVYYTGEDGKEQSFTFSEETLVDVEKMSDEEIESYVATGEPDDKAGGYGVQGLFAIFIKGIRGDYYNVVGLPIARLYKEMKIHNLL
ncbi:Maf family protein [Butyrivibrio sp. YAB3001]|uniref:Maf family protein n=1 Tax=Butyrivibrio sp. YAB3001 TaxID=1520812 RepID=UPI0008F62FD2|nr:Maf family protein [Butyrivibrio sp. YAB3001]SFB70903.1 septum formation protein [Butyrivibrio sp. YAB3001]